MKTILLFLLLSCLFSLSAQEDFTLKLTPSAYGEGRLYFAGQEQQNGNTVATDGDAEARIKAEFDYMSALGAVLEFEGDLKDATSDQASLGFGDDAYAYAHVLKIFGIDAKVFDIYLRGGRFEVEFQNAQYAGDDDWVADVAALSRDDKINMQLDFKLLDMLTLRYAFDFNPFEQRPVNDPLSVTGIGGTQRQRVELSQRVDMGWGLLFEKSFGKHKIQASLGYSVDVSPNRGALEEDTATNGLSYFAKEPGPANFDQLGLSVAYSTTFGRIAIHPFANLTLKSIFHKPYGAYHNPLWSWSAGGKFSFQDEANKYDIVGLGLDFDGSVRENRNYRDPDNKEIDGGDYIANKAFTGFQVKAWSHALKALMGERYLSFWGKARFEFWTPDLSSLERESILASWGFGLEQRIVNQKNASVKIIAEFTMENLAPFFITDNGYYSGLDASGSYLGERQDEPFRVYLDLGLEASFTGILKF